MSEQTGRAGFHVTHTKAVSERRAILHEAMRELDPEAIAYWAAKNPNIVVEDEPLNEAMVNDGADGFKPCTNINEVLEYGSERVSRLSHKLREDTLNPKTGKMTGGHVTTTLIVSHLPKSMCVEVPNFYPRFRKNGEPMLDPETGEPMMRSRWIARDRDEARKYFEEVVEYLARTALPGGKESVLGYDIQHSESTPHIQIIADTFAPDEKKPGELRASWAKAWGGHRDVRNDQGRIIYGAQKMSGYHAGLKAHLISKGYDVQADFDEELHLVGLGKDEYGAVMDAHAEIQALDAKHEREKDLIVEEYRIIKENHDRLTRFDNTNKENSNRLKEGFDKLEEEKSLWEDEKPKLRANAKDEGYKEGLSAAEATATTVVSTATEKAAQIEQDARERAQKIVQETLQERQKQQAQLAKTREQLNTALTEIDPLRQGLQEKFDEVSEFLRKNNPDGLTRHTVGSQQMLDSVDQIRKRALAALEASEDTMAQKEDLEFGG